MMPLHWNFFVAQCVSNWRNWDKHYYVPASQKLIPHYKSFLKTDGIDWTKRQIICSRHWSTPRRSFKHLPDVRLPGSTSKSKTQSKRNRLAKVQQLETKRKLNNKIYTKQKKVQVEREKEGEIISNQMKNLQSTVSDISNEKDVKELENDKLKLEVLHLKGQVAALQTKQEEDGVRIEELCRSMRQSTFDWQVLNEASLRMFTSFGRQELDVLFECFEPFLHLIQYQDCSDSMSVRRKTSKRNEFLAVLAICRNALPISVMAWMMNVSQSTMSRIFEAWICFGDAMFSMLDLQPSKLLIKSLMPDVYKTLGYGHVSLILDATEFKVCSFTDLNLNTLFFSDYKQTHTVKALVCITPHGALTKVPDLYPGSITDTMLTEITGSLDECMVHDGILTDKGFSISEIAAEKGAEHNRPPMKNADQFTEGQCDDNFKIACLRIHVERWIGYLRNFRILGAVWPCNRIDLLNSTWRFLAHLQAISTLVGPKK